MSPQLRTVVAREPHQRKSRMVEICKSGSGEGLGGVIPRGYSKDLLRVGRRGPHFLGPSAGATLQGCSRRFIPRIRRSTALRIGRPCRARRAKCRTGAARASRRHGYWHSGSARRSGWPRRGPWGGAGGSRGEGVRGQAVSSVMPHNVTQRLSKRCVDSCEKFFGPLGCTVGQVYHLLPTVETTQ